MIRPWKGVLSVALGLAALPAPAMAQDAPDAVGPTITIAAPTEGQTFTQGQPVTASYTCVDPSGVEQCDGSVADGATLSTANVGDFVFTLTAKDKLGNTSTATRNYSVRPVPGDVEGDAPATLNLTLGSVASFSPFVPALGRDYTATMAATVLSTAENATLSVADPSATATGHLVNGPFYLASALQASATSANEFANDPPLPLTDIGGSSAPTTLLTYRGPVSNDQATLNFKQSISGTEALRAGSYSKTLTFTLSTTAP